MSDKFCGLYVTFEKEISEEYLETVKQMIGSIKGVINVNEKLADPDHHFAYMQARHDFRMKVLKLLDDE